MAIVADSNAGEDAVCAALAERAVTFSREAMPVGDYVVSGHGRVLMFERKTLADWASSQITKNGSSRLYSQRRRMCELMVENPSVICYYILESTHPPLWRDGKSACGITEAATATSVLHTILRDHIPVIHTAGPTDTARMLQKAAESLASGKLSTLRFEYEGCLKAPSLGKRPREARAEMSPLVPALATVTGVSVRMAEAIVQSYPTARTLVAASPDGIADVKCGKRAVGPVVAGRIKALFA